MSFELHTVNAVTDLGELSGAAHSHRFLCDDENDYIVKFVENNNKIAINELVGGLIALNLDLPTPIKVLVNIPTEVIDESDLLPARNIQPILHIGSQELANEYEDFRKLGEIKLKTRKLINLDAFYGVKVFDNLVLNGDRNNPGNNMFAILPRNKMRYTVIDFSHCFTGENWTAENLEKQQKNKNVVNNFPFIENMLKDSEQFEPWLGKVESFDDGLIDSIFESVPNEWNVSENEKTIMSQFLKTRKDIVRNIILKKKE